MSGLQNFSDKSQSPGTSQRNGPSSTSAAPIKRKNSSPLANSIVPVLVDDDISELAQFPLLPPQPLRKSISVDSFAHYNHGYWPNRAQSVSRPESSRPTAPNATKIHLDKQRLASGRLRGESLSSGSSRISDADGDRYDPLSAAATERYRRGLSTTHDPTKPPIRGGDLPLPSRTLSNSVFTIASTSSTPPTVPADMPRNPSLVSGSSGCRSRSGSLGYNPSVSARKIMINTQVPPSIPRNEDIFLLVLGTHGCGKSTLIQKGISGANLGETSVICENPRYICHLAYVGLDKIDSRGSYSHVLQVIEGDISTATTSLPQWPSELPPIDGVILCYDSSSHESFRPIKGLLKGYREMGLPVVVLHCKADVTKEDGSGVNPQEALAEFQKYDTGLIQVSSVDPSIKYKMGKSIDYMLKAIVRQRGSNRVEDSRNPASPTILNKSSPSSPLVPQIPTLVKVLDKPASNTSQLSDLLLLDSVASGANQVGTDRLVSELNDSGAEPLVPEEQTSLPDSRALSNGNGPEIPSTQTEDVSDGDESHTEEESGEGQKDPGPLPTTNGVSPKGVKHGQWTHLDELLDRLLFIAISEEDSTFIVNFLLTYRRFATPRNVLLAMQKRIRQLDDPSGDPMFACFAQMRVCHLLETWIREYPNDFAVKGTVGALNALIKSIISKTHLLHYGSEFLPFLEQLSILSEEDSAWALKADIVDTDSENYYESEDDETRVEVEDTIVNDAASVRALSSSSKGTVPSRERKSSLPLTKTLFSAPPNEPTPKQLLKDLVKLANEVLTHDSDDIANEITRRGAELFLKIKPRDWVHFTFVSPTRKGEVDSIGEYNSMANYLADWVSCLILCHDQPRQRARQVEKFVEIALRIRHLNNYSGLRAFVAGINLAADDVTLEAFKMKSPEAAKNLMSWDVLLKQLRSHRAYRLALRNSRGGCIPALEVHMQDLIKANEGNPNQREDDPTLIHWGKYNMIGRFIGTVIQCQTQCRSSPSYKWTERRDIGDLLRKRTLMPLEMQEARLNIPDHSDNTPASSSHRDTRGLRKLIFW